MSDLPLEMFESVVMKAFLMLYSSAIVDDGARCPYEPDMSRRSKWRAFTLLASVSSYWRLTLTGWPGSPTGLWVRHKLRKLIEREFFSLKLAYQDL